MRTPVIVTLGAVLIALLVWALWPQASVEVPTELALTPDMGARPATPEEPFADPFAEAEPPAPPWGKQPSPEQRRAWRERMQRMREEWMALSPEERQRRMAERAERMVTIEALEETPPDLEPVDLMGSIRAVGGDIHQCVQSQGGWREFWSAVRAAAPDAGPGGRRAPTVSFEVDADGALDPESLVLEPPPPEGYSECFAEAWRAVILPAPNARASVEVRFGPPPGSRPPPFGGGPGGMRRSPESVMNHTP